MIATGNPFAQYFDKDGTPLDAGYLYFGAPNQNPQTSPIQVYFDEAGTIPAAQPIRTLNGYPSRAGTPARVYAAGIYSQTVLNKRGELVYTASTSADFTGYNEQDTITATSGQTQFPVDFPYSLNAGAIQVYVNGRLRTDEFVQSIGYVTIAEGLSAGDEVKIIVGSVINSSLPGDAVSQAALASADGDDMVGHGTLPDGSTATYLQTLSQIVNGDEVSFLRFVDGILHAAIRNRSNTTDLKARFEEAFASGVKGLYLPYGRYCTSPAVGSNINWLAIRGDSRFASQVALLSVGNAWTFNNMQQGHISGIEFVPIGTLAGSSGLVLADRTSVTTVTRCGFTAFKSSGLRIVGTVANQLSGNNVTECLFLANEGSQLYTEYNQDWWIEKNQYGWTGGTHPAVGCELVNSSQGTYAHNYHWENVVDLKATSCGGTRYVNNRIEESTQEGVIFTNCFHQTFALNRLYANSKGNANLYDAVVLVNENESTFQGNDVYDWTGGSQPHRYSYNIGSGCTNLTWKDNKATGYGTAPYATTGAAALTLNADPSPSWNAGAPAVGAFWYVGAPGAVATPALAQTMAGRRCVVVGFEVNVSGVTGASVAATLFKNGATTAKTATLGAAVFTANFVGAPELFNATDSWCVQLNIPGGANVVAYTIRLIVAER